MSAMTSSAHHLSGARHSPNMRALRTPIASVPARRGELVAPEPRRRRGDQVAPLQDRIALFLEDNGAATTTEIAHGTGYSVASTRAALRKLQARQAVQRCGIRPSKTNGQRATTYALAGGPK